MSAPSSSEALRHQFQQLQEQQQKKLARRKQLKGEREKGDRGKGDRQTSAATTVSFGVDDDLGLKLADPPAQGAIVSEDLVEHLNEQIREMKDETGRLYKLLSERDFEVRQLRKKSSGDRPPGGGGPVSSDTAGTKIVELSKKVRELTAELESERTRGKQLAKKCYGLENQLQNAINTRESGPTRGGTSNVGQDKLGLLDDINDRTSLESDLKLAQDKLRQTELKMAEFRNQCQSLRQEVKVANKVISQEVGEGATVQSLMNATSSWRGRAQQIITLQKKVNELRSQLDSSPPRGSGGGTSWSDDTLSSAAPRTSRPAEDRHRDQLRKMERERKEAHENLAKELKALEADHESLKHKMEASKARNKVISAELKSCKQQMSTLLDKGKHDDELIEALLKQQSRLKSALEKSSVTQQTVTSEQAASRQQMALRAQQENNVIEQLRAIVADREAKVRGLEHEIVALSRQKAQINGAHGSHMAFDQIQSESPTLTYPANQHTEGSPRPHSGPIRGEDSDLGTITPQSTARTSEARLSSRLSAREPSDLSDRPGSRRSSSRPGSRSDPSSSAVLSDLQREVQEHKSLCQAASVERDRLAELVTVLNKRVEELTQRATDGQTELVSQRRRNAQLEKQLGKVKVEQGSPAKKSSKPRVPGSSISLRESVTLDDDTTGATIDEMTTSLEIQRDENAALKAALQSTLRSKEEDLRLYAEMIDQTKKAFLQGLRAYRGQQA